MMATRYALAEHGRTGAASTCSTDSFTGSTNVRISPPSFSSYTTPLAMSIPGSNNRDEPPPPLPPPRYVPIDGPTVFDPRYGGPGLSQEGFPEERHQRENYKLRDRSYDEGYFSNASSRALSSPQFSMHHAYQARPVAHEYDSSMLSRLNTCNIGRTDNRSPTGSSNRLPALGSGRSPLASARSLLGSSAMDSTTNRPPPMQLPKLLSLPDRSRPHQPLNESPHRYNKSPLRSGYYTGDYRSPLSSEITEETDTSSSYPRTWRSNSGSGSIHDDATVSSAQGPRGGYDNREDDVDFPMDDTSSPVESLTTDDKLDTERDRRQKRRASSPPDETVLPAGSEMFRRRDVRPLTRGSPVPRLAPIPSSLSSTFSNISAGGRSASTAYTSATSMTSMASFGKSPVGPSPITPVDSIAGSLGSSMKDSWARSNFNSPTSNMASSLYSLAPSPQGLYLATGSSGLDDSSRRSSQSWQGTMQQQQQQQQQSLPQRLPMDAAPTIRRETGYMMVQDAGMERDSNSGSLAAKMQGFLMCECCPKKPKKFDTREALSAHEAEKQYQCQFCPNRFKNKNEAERHQNSLHLRRNSWSCSAMLSFEHAFHDSPTRPGEADSCGYCGRDFPRTGRFTGLSANSAREITHEDWETRAQHLQEVHKFRECNVTKKFWRADHFRQHLKHSHAGSSGKWTNLLESACMIDESPSPR